MRRALALLLGLCVIMALAGCGNTAPAESEPTAEPELTAEPTPAVTPEPTEEPLPFPELRLGETLETEGVTITLERAETLGAVTSVRRGEGITRNAPEGYKYLALAGTIKNTGPREIDADNLIGEVRVNGKYTYTLDKYVVQGIMFDTLLPPLAKGRLYLYAEIPEELADELGECRFSFGYAGELTEKPAVLALCDTARSLLFDPEGEYSVTVNGFQPEEYRLGETVTTEFAEVTFKEVKTVAQLKLKYKGGVYSMSTDQDMMLLCLTGTVKNTASETLCPAFSGTVTVDGYTYELQNWLVSNRILLAPLTEAPIYLYAQIPPELADSFESCEFRFGFNDDFANNAYTRFDACRYEYICRWEKEKE